MSISLLDIKGSPKGASMTIGLSRRQAARWRKYCDVKGARPTTRIIELIEKHMESEGVAVPTDSEVLKLEKALVKARS
jgi:hypothetical protein